MKERPILFSGPMVRAILEGRKTQTRRVVKPSMAPRPCIGVRSGTTQSYDAWCIHPKGLVRKEFGTPEDAARDLCAWSPYGQPGDRLWVREAWGFTDEQVKHTRDKEKLFYRASVEGQIPGLKFKPSIHMPRWASRITLEVTEVRVQRLQDISEEDAGAEGLIQAPTPDLRIGWGLPGWHKDQFAPTARQAFRTLWDSINGQRPGCDWASNPWVWAVNFRRVKP